MWVGAGMCVQVCGCMGRCMDACVCGEARACVCEGAWMCVKVCGCVQVHGCADKIEAACKGVLMTFQAYVDGQMKEMQCVVDKQRRCSL